MGATRGQRLAVVGPVLLLLAVGCASAGDDTPEASSRVTAAPRVGTTPPPTPPPGLAATSVPSDEETRTPLRRDLHDLQSANDHPRYELVTKTTDELADNRISLSYAGQGLWIDLAHLHDFVEHITLLGAKRISSSLYELEPPIDWELDEYHIPPEFDRFVDALADEGVAFDYILHFWDKEGHGRGETLSAPRFKDPQQVEDYVDYVRFIVRNFKGRIDNYTIWSEPDNCGQGGIKCIEAGDYVELVRQVIPVIREEDPRATVAIAPVVLFFERDFLPTVLRSGVAAMFDVIQWHGQYNVTPDDPFYRQHGDYYYAYPAIVEEIREVAEANGFRGEYWSTEMGWCSAAEDPYCENPDHPWGTVATNKVAAKYYARGVIAHLGMDILAGITPEAEQPWVGATKRYLATVMAGATPVDLAAEITDLPADVVGGPVQRFGFALPDGTKLFAVWIDGPAVHEDPTVSVTLTLPGLAATSAVGIDVVHGFEQELITAATGDDLVIGDLLVKDYPTLVRLEP